MSPLCAGAFALFSAAVPLCANAAGIAILQPAGPVALEERNIMIFTALLCSIVIVPVLIMLVVFAWRYRASNPATLEHHRPDWDHDNWVAEAIWWFVPAVIIVILAVLAWKSSHALDPYQSLKGGAAELPVDVVALDWKWLFIYPEQGIASVNLLEFPENTPVHLYLTADAPMNSLWVPQLSGQIMVMPGMTTQLSFAASRGGDFEGVSGNLSGDGFAGMQFTARAVSPSEFASWVSSVQASSSTLTSDTYAALAAPSSYNPVATYSSVAPGLFNQIVMKYMLPAAASDTNTMNMTNMQSMQGMQMTP